MFGSQEQLGADERRTNTGNLEFRNRKTQAQLSGLELLASGSWPLDSCFRPLVCDSQSSPLFSIRAQGASHRLFNPVQPEAGLPCGLQSSPELVCIRARLQPCRERGPKSRAALAPVIGQSTAGKAAEAQTHAARDPEGTPPCPDTNQNCKSQVLKPALPVAPPASGL